MIFLQFNFTKFENETPEGSLSWHTAYTCPRIFLLDGSGGNNFRNTLVKTSLTLGKGRITVDESRITERTCITKQKCWADCRAATEPGIKKQTHLCAVS